MLLNLGVHEQYFFRNHTSWADRRNEASGPDRSTGAHSFPLGLITEFDNRLMGVSDKVSMGAARRRFAMCALHAWWNVTYTSASAQ